jgi:hypothetical protein
MAKTAYLLFETEEMEKANPKNWRWLKRFLYWISEGAIKSVDSSRFCST